MSPPTRAICHMTEDRLDRSMLACAAKFQARNLKLLNAPLLSRILPCRSRTARCRDARTLRNPSLIGVLTRPIASLVARGPGVRCRGDNQSDCELTGGADLNVKGQVECRKTSGTPTALLSTADLAPHEAYPRRSARVRGARDSARSFYEKAARRCMKLQPGPQASVICRVEVARRNTESRATARAEDRRAPSAESARRPGRRARRGGLPCHRIRIRAI